MKRKGSVKEGPKEGVKKVTKDGPKKPANDGVTSTAAVGGAAPGVSSPKWKISTRKRAA